MTIFRATCLLLVFAVSAWAAQPPGKVKERGIMEVLVIDRDDGTHEDKYFLHSDKGRRHELKFKKRPNIQTDAEVEVDGLEKPDGSIDVEVMELAQVLSNTFGSQRTIVMLVNFADNTIRPYTADFARSVFATVNAWYRENSYQQTWLSNGIDQADQVDILGWLSLPLASTGCPYSQIASAADQAAAVAGINLAQYRRKVYAFPSIPACGWWGLGTVGGNPSRAWINGQLELAVAAHELGHNFGLYHARSQCAPNCPLVEYGDIFDIMGRAKCNCHVSAFQKERVGWLDYAASPPLTTITAGGRYRIGPYETVFNEPKALKILKGGAAYYYLEYRSQRGFDAGIGLGVIMHVGNNSVPSDIILWDLDQQSLSVDWILNVGQTYTDPAIGLSLTLVSMDGAGAEIDVVMPGSGLPAPTNLVVK
jgi:hypothetical protein